MSPARALETLARFVVSGAPPAEARRRASVAVLDTVGVALAGSAEPAACIVRDVIGTNRSDPCVLFGAADRAGAADAAWANGTAAHALDFDDMCFVSLAHPSAPLVPALIAAAELAAAPGRALLDGYAIGFEIEARLGAAMNPRHYQRGWHCTSTLGTVGAAAGASRVLGLTVEQAAHALAIAASEASGLKENFGSMVKPLHAGLAARNGVIAALLARAGLVASASAIDGPQGFLHAMDAEHASFGDTLDDLGRRWEIVDTGVTVKLYPSCAGTHPTIDAVLDLRSRHHLLADDIAAIDVGVDAITPTVLLYDRPASGLEGKFSMPFCVAAALVYGRVGVETFFPDRLSDPAVVGLMPRVTMRVDPALASDASHPPLTRARVTITLTDGRVLTTQANGARGYPANPAGTADLHAKFLGCARAVLSREAADRALEVLSEIDRLDSVQTLTVALAG